MFDRQQPTQFQPLPPQACDIGGRNGQTASASHDDRNSTRGASEQDRVAQPQPLSPAPVSSTLAKPCLEAPGSFTNNSTVLAQKDLEFLRFQAVVRAGVPKVSRFYSFSLSFSVLFSLNSIYR